MLTQQEKDLIPNSDTLDLDAEGIFSTDKFVKSDFIYENKPFSKTKQREEEQEYEDIYDQDIQDEIIYDEIYQEL